MSIAEIKVEVGDRPRRGKYPIRLVQEETVLFTGEVDPYKPEEVKDFVDRACAEVPAIEDKADELRHYLLQLATRSTNAESARNESASQDHPYVERQGGGLVWMKPTMSGVVPVVLTNFTAKIVAEVVRDDGTEQEVTFEVEASQGNRTSKFNVSASRFPAMNWPVEQLGASAIVNAGQSTKDHARAAIQFLSGKNIVRRVVYTHTGWREINPGTHAFLHAGGAIGPDGEVHDVGVEFSGALSSFRLPKPPEGEDLVHAIKAALRILELGPREVTFPAFCAVWRAGIGACDFGLHFCGPSGVFKSEEAALLQQFFGAEMDSRHLPGSWHSTDNYLEGLLFAAKNTVVVIDDFAPCGGPHDIARWHQRADRVIRAQGNNSARSRMRSDGTLRPPKPPRGLVISTGEDIPRGHSLRARILILELSKGSIDPVRLTACQRDAREGLYAAAMAGFLFYLAARIEQVRVDMRSEIERLRTEAAGEDSHCRTPEIVANLAFGLHHFLDYARHAGVLTPAEADALWTRAWAALVQAGRNQATHQIASEPATRFMELLKSALGSGHAHLAAKDGSVPTNPGACGWRKVRSGLGDEWQPQGIRVGWVEEGTTFLDPDASYKAAQAMAGSGDGLVVSARTLRKRLFEKCWSIREPNRDQQTVRRVLEGTKREVIQLAPNAPLLSTETLNSEGDGEWQDA